MGATKGYGSQLPDKSLAGCIVLSFQECYYGEWWSRCLTKVFNGYCNTVGPTKECVGLLWQIAKCIITFWYNITGAISALYLWYYGTIFPTCSILIWREAPDCIRATRFLQRRVCGWNCCFWDFQIEVRVRNPVSVRESKGNRTLIVLFGTASK